MRVRSVCHNNTSTAERVIVARLAAALETCGAAQRLRAPWKHAAAVVCRAQQAKHRFFDNGGRPTPRVGPRSTLAAFVGTLCAHRPFLGSSLFPKAPNIDLFISTNCQTSLLPGPSPTPQSRHLRSPGAQLHHSIITAFRSAASVGRLGNLTPRSDGASHLADSNFRPSPNSHQAPEPDDLIISPLASTFTPEAVTYGPLGLNSITRSLLPFGTLHSAPSRQPYPKIKMARASRRT